MLQIVLDLNLHPNRLVQSTVFLMAYHRFVSPLLATVLKLGIAGVLLFHSFFQEVVLYPLLSLLKRLAIRGTSHTPLSLLLVNYYNNPFLFQYKIDFASQIVVLLNKNQQRRSSGYHNHRQIDGLIVLYIIGLPFHELISLVN